MRDLNPTSEELLHFVERLLGASSEADAVQSLFDTVANNTQVESAEIVLRDGNHHPWDIRRCNVLALPVVEDTPPSEPPGLGLTSSDDRLSITVPFRTRNLAAIRFVVLKPMDEAQQEVVLALGRIAAVLLEWAQTNSALASQVDDISLIATELEHRLKNAYANASGIASLTLPPQLAHDFRRRMMSLSVASPSVGGCPLNETMSTISEHLAAVLAPYQKATDTPIRLDGPLISIGNVVAVPLTLVFNELATNAVKYGALSSDKGRIDISWGHHDEDVVIDWRERGVQLSDGPAIPSEGSAIVDRIVERFLCGKITRSQTTDGIHICLRIRATAFGS